MTSAAHTLKDTSKPNLRQFDFRRDLRAVADLVELCFADRLDDDGRKYVQQMRAAAGSGGILGWAKSTAERASMPMGGFVWQEGRVLVANLSLLPVTVSGEQAYLIANVAVHPDFRRRGIARELTEAAFEHIRIRKVKCSWLQVDDDNLAALELYQDLGFKEVVRRTTWHSDPSRDLIRTQNSLDLSISSRRSKDWPQQKTWLNQLYPSEVSWHLPLRLPLLQPGISGSFYRFVNEKRVRQWSVHRGGSLLGVLTRQSSPSQADRLWLASHYEHEEEALRALLPVAQHAHPSKRTLALDYPAGRAIDAIREAGFYNHQTLIWMNRQI